MCSRVVLTHPVVYTAPAQPPKLAARLSSAPPGALKTASMSHNVPGYFPVWPGAVECLFSTLFEPLCVGDCTWGLAHAHNAYMPQHVLPCMCLQASTPFVYHSPSIHSRYVFAGCCGLLWVIHHSNLELHMLHMC